MNRKATAGEASPQRLTRTLGQPFDTLLDQPAQTGIGRHDGFDLRRRHAPETLGIDVDLPPEASRFAEGQIAHEPDSVAQRGVGAGELQLRRQHPHAHEPLLERRFDIHHRGERAQCRAQRQLYQAQSTRQAVLAESSA